MDISGNVNNFYALPLVEVFVIMLCLVMTWAVITKLLRRKEKAYQWWKRFNIVLCICSFLLIIKMTLWGRNPGVRELELLPFYTFTTVSYNNEAFRTMLMNVMLFVPFGLTIPYVIEVMPMKERRYRWITCVLIGLLISVAVEGVQYWLGIGRTETDDVICNTVGCLMGVSHKFWYRKNY